MELINDYSEVSPLVREYFKVGMATNNFLKEDDYKYLIDKKRLFYYKWNGGVFFLKKRESDFLCLYQIINFDLDVDYIELENIDLPIVSEIVLMPNDKNIDRIKSFFLSLGFEICLTRVRMKLDKNKVSDKNFNSDYEIKYATIEQANDIILFLKNNFDIHTGCIPSNNELELDVKNEKVLIAVNRTKQLIGVLHFSLNNSKAEIRHLAVNEEYRNKGIASNLIAKYHENAKSKNAYLWVSENNEIAQNFYVKNGYAIDAYKSIVMIKRKGELNGKTKRDFVRDKT